MATAGAILGLRVPGVEIEDIGTTAKTLPTFVTLWEQMLAPALSGEGWRAEPPGAILSQLRRIRCPGTPG